MIALVQEIQSLSPSAEMEFYELDTTMFEGGGLLRFHSGVGQTNYPIVWQGESYQPFPIEAKGFDVSSQGTLPQPTLTIANVDGILTALVLQYEDLAGAKITRKRTFARYLDAVNFPDGNPDADPTQYLDDQLWWIEQKKVENAKFIQWKLSSAFDMDGVRLPFRQIIKNTCTWTYRSAQCGYTGGYFDKNDNPTTNANEDTCAKRLGSCKAHFGVGVTLPFGGFPGATRGDE